MSVSVERWFQTISKHYNSLDDFKDGFTLRSMLRFVDERLKSIDETTKLLEDFIEERAQWISDTIAEYTRLLIYQDALSKRIGHPHYKVQN